LLTSWRAGGSRRNRLPARSASAFAPAAITNFFETHSVSSHLKGATGGGYILSRGTRSTVVFSPIGDGEISATVDGDPAYDARTTRRALRLLFSDSGRAFGKVQVDQTSETPIGSGFAASASAALSAVYAAASAADIGGAKKDLAVCAHEAEILEQTGVGTVSVIYDSVGAGAITVAGEPGEARFVEIRVPRDVRLVTAVVAPFDKKDALSSPTVSRKINALGREALRGFLSDPTLDNLAEQGERFSTRLGLETPEVKKLIAMAKRAGAEHASQNMIGYSVHSIVREDRCERVAEALRASNDAVRVDVFEVGREKARVLKASRRSRGPS
jgi:pantoate kinase